MVEVKKPRLRHELKYQIDALEHQLLQKKLSTLLQPDPATKENNHYNIRSLYFDDIENSALSKKQAGIYERKKYRIRIYNHSDSQIKFERKTKIGSLVLKECTQIIRADAEKLIAKKYDFLAKTDNPLLRDFYLETKCKLMRPVVIVEYDREAYIHQIGNVRVTFDSNLRIGYVCTSFFDMDDHATSVFNQKGIVLEVKYTDVLPSFISGLFPNTIRPQQAIGKFVLCREQQISQSGNSNYCS